LSRVLALDGALARCSAGLVADGALVASRVEDGARGHAAVLPRMAADVLAEAGCAADALDLVAVTVGPGGFTGLRAALSLAQGLALGAGVPVVGVTVGEALAEALPHLGGRALWVAIDSRRGQVFLERDGRVRTERLEALPASEGRIDRCRVPPRRTRGRCDAHQCQAAAAPPCRARRAATPCRRAAAAPSPAALYRSAGGAPARRAGASAAGMIRAAPAHAAALAAIHAAAFAPPEAWGSDAMALQLGMPGAFGFLDPRGGMVLARAVTDEAEILTLAVAPEARRQGIARALLAAAMEEARTRGAAAMFLEVAEPNRVARALYAAAGFTQLGKRRGYYPNGEDALVLRAVLIPSGSLPG
jgi:[ribosomal protein S18]-alanine N-acetyltransferase